MNDLAFFLANQFLIFALDIPPRAANFENGRMVGRIIGFIIGGLAAFFILRWLSKRKK